MKRSPMPPRKKPMKRTGFKKRRFTSDALEEVNMLRHSRSQKFKRLGDAKPRKKLRQKSKKRIAEEKEYSKLRAEFLKEHPICQRAKCHHPATEVHHKAGRYEFYLRVDTFMACCHPCHSEITRRGEWARANHYTLTTEERRLLD